MRLTHRRPRTRDRSLLRPPTHPGRQNRNTAADTGANPAAPATRHAACGGTARPSARTSPAASSASPRAGTHRCKRRRSRVLLALCLVAAGLLLTGSAASAETVHVVALAQTLDEVLGNIQKWIMGILAGVATVFLSIGGLRYLMASGDPSEIEKAKGAFKAACIGFALAALAPIVVGILKNLVGGV